jgi:hypothetical protein
MSYKPSRSSGLTYEKHKLKAYHNLNAAAHMEWNPPKMKDINKLSRHIYLYWLNDNKAEQALGKKGNLPFGGYYCSEYLLNIFQRHISLVYAPARETIRNADLLHYH